MVSESSIVLASYVQSSKLKLVLVPDTEEAIVMLVTSLF